MTSSAGAGLSSRGTGPTVSVLTPTWNRAPYLEKVWEGLNSQSYRNFEWIVADDGSTDDTAEVIKSLAARSDFPITYVRASVRIGKPRMDNELLSHATGEFLIWNDSDDWHLPHALGHFVETWDQIPVDERCEYIGITALCTDASGRVQSSAVPFDQDVVTTWDELRFVHRVGGDMHLMIQRSSLGDRRFCEVDFMITESSFWQSFSGMKTIFSPVIVKIVDRNAANRISFSGKMEYCRGKAHGLALVETAVHVNQRSLFQRLWLSIIFWRYAYLGEIPFGTARRLWKGSVPGILHMATAPFGWALAWKDMIQGKVVRTHREYDRAKTQVQFRTTRFNQHHASTHSALPTEGSQS